MLAIIGGSGFDSSAVLQEPREMLETTRFGEPSAPLLVGSLGATRVIVLARHGRPHRIPPHRINYRANILALRQAGVRRVVAVASVGGIAAGLGAGAVIVPDQIIDYTHSRDHTFCDDGSDPLRHIDFTQPFDTDLRERLIDATHRLGISARSGGTYAATQGPRLETAAEIRRLQRDGADMVGMTGMPEAALAREAGLAYAMLAVVANDAAGIGESAERVSLDAAHTAFAAAMQQVVRIVQHLAEDL